MKKIIVTIEITDSSAEEREMNEKKEELYTVLMEALKKALVTDGLFDIEVYRTAPELAKVICSMLD